MIRDFSCPQGRVTARGYGEDKPLIADQEILKLRAPEEKENLHRKNRRTEIKILEVR
jgi:outer membrane protein OmpA-like peptidoglycan-associated protein